jgi:hypothetical protein
VFTNEVRNVARVIGILAMIGAMAMATPANALWPDKVPVWEWCTSRFADAVEKAKEAKEARKAANASLEAARQKFFADRKAGLSDPESLQDFQIQLWQKDIYYLTPYLNEGMTPRAVKLFEGVEKLTGGLLDGGIPPDASGQFEEWVTMVRAALHAPAPGTIWLPSQAELIAALAATTSTYEKYRVVRDRAELWRWKNANRKTVPLATTPEKRAEDYIQYNLDVDIEREFKGLSEQERPGVSEKLSPWREELRKAIVDYEKSEVTRGAVAECLRALPEHPEIDPPGRTERLVQRFLQETEPVAGLPPEAQFEALVPGYVRFFSNLDKERYGRTVGSPPIEITRVRLKDCASAPAQKQLMWLYGEGQPIKFSRTPYWSCRGQQYYIYPD